VEYNIISGDSHIDMTWMPGDLWASQAPLALRDDAPRVIETDEGLKWTAEGKILGVFGGSSFGFGKAERGSSRRIDSMFDEGFYEGAPRPTTPELRLKDMERDGVDAEVLYGVLGVGLKFENPELTRYVYNVYYQWAADFCQSNPGRWAALAPISSHDPRAAAEDLRLAAKLGLKGADFAVSNAVKPLYHSDWDVLWDAASECAMPVSFHFTVGMKPSIRQPDPEDMPAYKDKVNLVGDACSQLEGALHLTSIIYSGACERFPNLQWVLGETGVTWVPFLIARMDAHHKDQRHMVDLPLAPSQYWRRQGHATFQTDSILADMIDLVGDDNAIWGSDYPHPDGVWPDSLATISQDLGRLEASRRQKIICGTAGRLYGFFP
jgi:predicted TIM-barrel fold metal-dependent hydrolase